MTEQSEPATEPSEPDPGDDIQQPKETGSADGGNREAARYRVRLRETEAERDAVVAEREQLRGVVVAMQRGAAEQLASDGAVALERGDDLWTAGVELDSLLDDAGQLDEAKVRDAVAGVLKDRPPWTRHRVAVDVGRLTPGAAAGRPRPAEWAELLRGV